MKSALLVIDVQRGLFGPEPQPFEAHEVIQRINQLASSAREAGWPVIYVQHERDGTSLKYQSPGWALDERLASRPEDLYVRKTTPDCFLRTNLQQLLELNSVSCIVVTGYASEFCVDTTCRRAAALGYEVILASDTHTTHDRTHATAEAIRAHENATLPGITSFGPTITAKPAASIKIAA